MMRTLLVRSRIERLSGALALDEVLVADSRAFLRPAQLVERKLMSLLKNVYMPLSHARVTTLVMGRGLPRGGMVSRPFHNCAQPVLAIQSDLFSPERR
jgi:hypothetical protein